GVAVAEDSDARLPGIRPEQGAQDPRRRRLPPRQVRAAPARHRLAVPGRCPAGHAPGRTALLGPPPRSPPVSHWPPPGAARSQNPSAMVPDRLTFVGDWSPTILRASRL